MNVAKAAFVARSAVVLKAVERVQPVDVGPHVLSKAVLPCRSVGRVPL